MQTISGRPSRFGTSGRDSASPLRVDVPGLMAVVLAGGCLFAAEQVVPVGNVGDGERVTVMRADSNGVPRTVGNVRVERTIRSLLEAPVGAKYAPDAADFAAFKAYYAFVSDA